MEDRLNIASEFNTPFIDEILVGTRAEEGEDLYEKHYLQVYKVMEILEKDQFVGDVRKAHFFIPEVKFCGHILEGGTRRPEPGKLMAIEKWELPHTISELRAFWVSQIIMFRCTQKWWQYFKISSRCQENWARKEAGTSCISMNGWSMPLKRFKKDCAQI